MAANFNEFAAPWLAFLRSVKPHTTRIMQDVAKNSAAIAWVLVKLEWGIVEHKLSPVTFVVMFKISQGVINWKIDNLFYKYVYILHKYFFFK